jgi:hypothetical protein
VSSPADKLTDRQRAFVAFYLGEARFNATRAAALAGYSPRTARTQGSRLLTNPGVGEAIRKELHKRGITPDAVRIGLAEVAFGADMADFEPFLQGRATLGELRDRGVNMRLVKSAWTRTGRWGEISASITLYDSLRALETLARILRIGQEPDDTQPPRLQVVDGFVESLKAKLEQATHKRYHPNLPPVSEVLRAHGIDDGSHEDPEQT